ncbi:MAG: hypothetical protein HKN25_04780 [Pyrinomonadaceae bacterium]|nr:hypothetical protein [Pyrinomonadaceae bacterium]
MEREAMEQRWIMVKKFGASEAQIREAKAIYKKEGLDGMRRHNLKNRLAGIKTKLEKDKNSFIKYGPIARAYANLKDKEKTLEYLNKAYQQRETGLVSLRRAPRYKFLKDEPEFQELIKKVGIPGQ